MFIVYALFIVTAMSFDWSPSHAHLRALCGFLAPFFLTGLAVFDKRRHVRMHNICASVFFVTAIACAVLHAAAYQFVVSLKTTDPVCAPCS